MGEAAPKDNSMEEILASIRRIISSDDEAPATGRKTAERDIGKAPPSASGQNAAATSQKPPAESQTPQASQPAEPQTSFRPQASTSVPSEGGAGTLAGLAQQLRGTRGLNSPDGKPDTPDDKPETLAPETASAQANTLKADAVEDAPLETTEADAVRSGNSGIDAAGAKPGVSSGAISASSSQNLADLAKSINEKIGAASRMSGGQSDAAAGTGDAVKQEPEAAVEPSAGTLAGIAEAVQTDLRASAAEDTVADEKAAADDEDPANSKGESEVRTESMPAAGADSPEAFREALVSPSTQQAVSGSMSRLKQAASELTQAQVEATLRPLLREWLDDNLPGLVERMVQQEIDRIAAQSAGDEAGEAWSGDLPPQSKSA